MTAARIAGLVDSAQSWLIERGQQYSGFDRWILRRYYCEPDNDGVFAACVVDGGLWVVMAFEIDVPEEQRNEITGYISASLRTDAVPKRVWCCYENTRLVEMIATALDVRPDYAAYELAVTRSEFERWEEPVIGYNYRTSGYSQDEADDYVSILDRSMEHLSDGYFLDRKAEYAKRWSLNSQDNYFVSLICGSKCVGMCHGWRSEIERLAVDRNHRRKGCGYALLYETLSQMLSNRDDGSAICLYVVESNYAAKEFYVHVGMRTTGHSARFTIS